MQVLCNMAQARGPRYAGAMAHCVPLSSHAASGLGSPVCMARAHHGLQLRGARVEPGVGARIPRLPSRPQGARNAGEEGRRGERVAGGRCERGLAARHL